MSADPLLLGVVWAQKKDCTGFHKLKPYNYVVWEKFADDNYTMEMSDSLDLFCACLSFCGNWSNRGVKWRL